MIMVEVPIAVREKLDCAIEVSLLNLKAELVNMPATYLPVELVKIPVSYIPVELVEMENTRGMEKVMGKEILTTRMVMAKDREGGKRKRKEGRGWLRMASLGGRSARGLDNSREMEDWN